MKDTQRTPYGSYIDLCLRTRVPVVHNTGISLNTKFGVLPDELPDEHELPIIQYLTIGNGGYGGSVPSQVDGRLPVSTSRPRRSEAMALYHHIPLAIRPVYSDLVGAERDRYRLRSIQMINGTEYAVYMAIMTQPPTLPSINKLDLSTSKTIGLYTPTIDVLNPPYLEQLSDGQQQEYVQITSLVSVTMDQVAIDNIKQAALIMYGDSDHGVIREVGLCTGVEDNGEALVVSLYSSANVNNLLGVDEMSPGVVSIALGSTDVIYLPPA